jgi:hypothetical protein
MNSDQLFSICNTLVLPGWVLLVLTPKWKWTERIIIGVIILLLCLLYTYLVIQNFRADDFAGFGSLAGVMELFSDKNMVLAGWIHYLAFDLLVGFFEVKNAQKHTIHHLLVIPCLLLTFMLGPLGFLLFIIIRAITTKQYFSVFS